MSLSMDSGWLVAALLLSLRFGAATVAAPVLGPTQVPGMARVILALSVGGFLAAALPMPQTMPAMSIGQLTVAALGELIVGFSFAFGFIVAYGATQLAGRALDIQIGFGAASVLNPTTQAPSSLLGSVFGMVAVAVFLALDGHLVLMKALAVSVATLPPGELAMAVDGAVVLKHSAATFVFALAFAGPVMLLFFLSDVTMAVFARSMPQLNVFVLGFVVKIVLGLMGLALSIRFASAVLDDLFAATFSYWENAARGPNP
jgi:flagellar biosynthetic protein FliR